MKKFLTVWLSLSALTALIIALVRWANHPDLVRTLQNEPEVSALFAFAIAWLLRRYVFAKDAEWIRGLGLAFVLFWVQKSFLVPTIPSHDFAQKILWPWAAVFCVYQLVYLAWEEWTGFLERSFLSRVVPALVWPALFAAALFWVSVKVRLHPSLTPHGVWSDIENYKNLALALMLVFWGLIPLLRRTLLHKEEQVFRALGFLLFTLFLYRQFPDTLRITYYDQEQHKNIVREWTFLLVWAHFLLTAYVAVLWEKLREPRWSLRIGALILGFLPLVVSTYFNPRNLVWVYQIAGLAAFWNIR